MLEYEEISDVLTFFNTYPYWSCHVFWFEYRPEEQTFQLEGAPADFSLESGCRKFISLRFEGVEQYHHSMPKGYVSPYTASPYYYKQQPGVQSVEVHAADTAARGNKYRTVLEMTFLMGNLTLVYERAVAKVKIGRGVQTGPASWDYFDVATGKPFDFYRPFAG